MIKANEIRIGNIFNWDTVDSPSYFELEHFEYLDRLNPIPLTEQWLLKFGWGKGEYDTEYVDNVSLKQECLSYNVGAKMFCIETNGDIMEIKHIRYVHQLQNIFYCLTGQELELK